MPPHRVRVYPLPAWIEVERWLGPGAWTTVVEPDGRRSASATLERAAAADLAARLRGLGLGGHAIAVEVEPPLPRAALRRARADDARRRRETTPLASRPGIRMDEEARFSWTAEALARRLGRAAAGRHVVDACCGAGGNTIGFALEGCRVEAIEIDESRVAMAHHNVESYAVAGRVELVAGDAVELLEHRTGEILFIDPPWGRDWDRERMALEQLTPLRALLERSGGFADVWCKLPPSFDVGSLAGSWEIEPVFGVAAGDRRRVKFLWARRASDPTSSSAEGRETQE